MFPKQAFDGKSKQAAKNHWLEFQKYITYQQQQELLDPDDDDQFPEVNQMFRAYPSRQCLRMVRHRK